MLANRGFDAVIFGHTHRAARVELPNGAVYFNSGNWPRDSSYVEVLGTYNPRTNPEALKINQERLAHWLKLGAQPSDTVRTLVDRMPEAPATEAPVVADASAS